VKGREKEGESGGRKGIAREVRWQEGGKKRGKGGSQGLREGGRGGGRAGEREGRSLPVCRRCSELAGARMRAKTRKGGGACGDPRAG